MKSTWVCLAVTLVCVVVFNTPPATDAQNVNLKDRLRLNKWLDRYRPKLRIRSEEVSESSAAEDGEVERDILDERALMTDEQDDDADTQSQFGKRWFGKFAFKVWRCITKWCKSREFIEEERDVSDDDQETKKIVEILEDKKNEEEIEKSLQLATPKDLAKSYDEKVVKAEKYELPILKKEDEWFRSRHSGVVVTLQDGRRLLIVKGFEFGRFKSTAVLDASIMSEYWQLIDTKNVADAKVKDYVLASETSANSRQATAKMMQLN